MKLRRVIYFFYFFYLIELVILSFTVLYCIFVLLDFALIYIILVSILKIFFYILCLAMKTSGGQATGKLFMVRGFFGVFIFSCYALIDSMS